MPRPPVPVDDELSVPHDSSSSDGGLLFGWSAFAVLALVGFCFGAWVGNQRPKEIVKTVPAEVKTEPKVAPEKKEPPKAKEPEPEAKPQGKEPGPEPKPKSKEPEPEPKPKAKEPEPKPKEPSPEPKTVTAVAFDKEILPIFKSKCMLCHGDTKGVKGGLDLRTIASIKKGGDSGDALVAGNLEKSLIWSTIEDGAMPPPDKPQLTDAEKKKIKDWILSGGK